MISAPKIKGFSQIKPNIPSFGSPYEEILHYLKTEVCNFVDIRRITYNLERIVNFWAVKLDIPSSERTSIEFDVSFNDYLGKVVISAKNIQTLIFSNGEYVPGYLIENMTYFKSYEFEYIYSNDCCIINKI